MTVGLNYVRMKLLNFVSPVKNALSISQLFIHILMIFMLHLQSIFASNRNLFNPQCVALFYVLTWIL